MLTFSFFLSQHQDKQSFGNDLNENTTDGFNRNSGNNKNGKNHHPSHYTKGGGIRHPSITLHADSGSTEEPSKEVIQDHIAKIVGKIHSSGGAGLTTEQLAASLNVPINDKTQKLLENLNIQLTQTSSNDSSKSSDTRKSDSSSNSPKHGGSGYNEIPFSQQANYPGSSMLEGGGKSPSRHNHENYSNSSRPTNTHHSANPIPHHSMSSNRGVGSRTAHSLYRGENAFNKSNYPGGSSMWN